MALAALAHPNHLRTISSWGYARLPPSCISNSDGYIGSFSATMHHFLLGCGGLIQLVLGGARSGKSRFAESIVAESGLSPVYVATAEARDEEMRTRIGQHQNQRKKQSMRWDTREEPLYLAKTLTTMASDDRCILVDCLTLWLTNCLLSGDSSLWPQQKKALLETLEALPGQIILVSNEVGHGIVPLGELNRQFVDESGWLHQSIATIADSVSFVVAGCPIQLK